MGNGRYILGTPISTLSWSSFIFYGIFYSQGFPGGSEVKESACKAENLGSIPELGRFPWRRGWLPTLVLLPGKSIDREPGGLWVVYRVEGAKIPSSRRALLAVLHRSHRRSSKLGPPTQCARRYIQPMCSEGGPHARLWTTRFTHVFYSRPLPSHAGSWGYYYPLFTDEEIKAQGCLKRKFSKSHSW